MIKKLSFALMLAVASLVFASGAYACSKPICKSETEFKINLTAKAYNFLKNTLLKKYDAESSERTDVYFDIFKDNTYYLKVAEPPIKLRFQYDGETLKWQTQKTTLQGKFSIFSMKKTDAIAMEIHHEEALFESIEHYHELLKDQNPEALVWARNIQDKLEQTNILNFTRALCENCSKDARYYSTHINHKKRTKTKIKIADDTFSIQVGETNNDGILTFELEAEVKKDSNLALSAERLNSWLVSLGMTPDFIETQTFPDPALSSEKALQKLHSL